MSYESVVKEDSPKGFWRLGEASGTSAADASGNTQTGGYKGTPTLGVRGIPGTTRDPNTSVTLNGTTQYVTVPDSATLDLGDIFTYEAWIKRSSTGNPGCILDKGPQAAVLRFVTASNKILFRRNSVLDLATSTLAITDTTTWHHIVATKNGATVNLYIDGVNRTGAVTNSTCANTALPLGIGADEVGTTAEDFFPGTLDEVAVYGTALTEARVKAHYEAGLLAFSPASLLGVGR